jgi:hypothetical protein
MLKDDPLAWEAHRVAGDLFLEKYNRADGLPELKQALAINPRAAEVLVWPSTRNHRRPCD